MKKELPGYNQNNRKPYRFTDIRIGGLVFYPLSGVGNTEEQKMTIFDYLEKNCGARIYKDECGNVYMDYTEGQLYENELYENIISGAIASIDPTDGSTTWLIPKEVYEKHSEIEIVITEDEAVNSIHDFKNPYYRMRGVPVTREQAFDIIRRTDKFLDLFEKDATRQEEYIGNIGFYNDLLGKSHDYPGDGWIHVDGTVGINGAVYKYPTISELLLDWYRLLYAFPYLDLILAVTWRYPYDPYEETVTEKELEKEFCQSVAVGIYVHDRKLEILDRTDAIAKYKEYNKRYGTPPEKFEPEYYRSHKIVQADPSYVRKCIEAYGLDADKVLEQIRG